MCNYEKALLCMSDDWYGRMDDLVADLEHYGFDILEMNSEYVVVAFDDDGDDVQIVLHLSGTERTIVIKDFEEVARM